MLKPDRGFWLTALACVVAAPAAAQNDGATSLRFGVSSFVVARYASSSASSLYAGYSLGPIGILVAAVHNPRSGYSEILGGLVTRLAAGNNATHVALAVAEASDGKYLQTYLVPSLEMAGLKLSATIEWYEPLESSAVRQFDVNPVSVLRPIGEKIAVGAAYTLGLGEGAESRQRAGPVLQLTIPKGIVYAEFLRNVSNSKAEARVGLQAVF